MSLVNQKKPATNHIAQDWSGVVARISRGGSSSRSARRSALLGVLTSVYANAQRGPKPAEARGTDRS